MNQMFLTQRRKTFIVTNKRGEQGKKAKMSLSQVEHYTIFCLFLWAEKKCSFAAIVFILYDFSVAKATLELQMSVCLSVHQSVRHKNPSASKHRCVYLAAQAQVV